MKRIIEEIEESVRIHGHDGQQGLGIWLDYLVDMFDVKYIVNGTYDKHLEDKAKEDEHLFNATILWLEIISKHGNRVERLDRCVREYIRGDVSIKRKIFDAGTVLYTGRIMYHNGENQWGNKRKDRRPCVRLGADIARCIYRE